MDKTQLIFDTLAKIYPNPTTALKFSTPFQLLIATILSAQCTDQRVNQITAKLFQDYPTVEKMVQLSIPQLENLIKSAGLWQTKARNIKGTCELIITKYQGHVPNTREELMTLPGVGRKTANVVLANAFNIPAIAVDTHVQRVANRLGLTCSNNPYQIEQVLMEMIPQKNWKNAHHWLIYHGRQVCKARKPLCANCPLQPYCSFAATKFGLQSDGQKQ